VRDDAGRACFQCALDRMTSHLRSTSNSTWPRCKPVLQSMRGLTL